MSDPRRVRADRNAVLYVAGLAASTFGSSAFALTAGIWVKTLSGSNGLAGLVSFCVWGPSLATPLFGLLADRVRRRRLVVAVNAATAAALVPLWLVHDGSDVWLLFAVMTAYGLALAVLDPAESALVAGALRPETLARVNGVRTTVTEGWKLVAPLAGAGVFVAAGGGVLAMLDAATFLVAALACAGMRLDDTAPRRGGEDWLTELRTGLRHVLGDRAMRTLLVGSGIVLAVNGLRSPGMFAAVDLLGRPPAFLGVLGSAQGAGSVLGGLLSIRFLRAGREVAFATAGAAVAALGGLLQCLPSVTAVAVGSAANGCGLPWLLVAGCTMVQTRTPNALQGRVASVTTMLLFTGQTLSLPVGSLLVGLVDYRVTFAAYGVVALLCAVRLHRIHPSAAGRDSFC
ncbi:MAG TPA: MFS transporter [Streptosporangiales bacterium]